MSLGIVFIIIGVIVIAMLQVNDHLNAKKFVNELDPYFKFLKESDYGFLLNVKYGNVDENIYYQKRVRNGIIAIVLCFFVLLSQMSFLYVMLSVIVGYLVFKYPYWQLSRYYKANLHRINLTLPYYLKSLEILIQHYTVPVALAKSIDSAPEIFQPGLRRLVDKINEGDSSIQPYVDFANEYPVRDSMRMMRLLYRLNLGSQENKQEQLLMFSRSISSLQSKARSQRYQERLDKMENKTMMMLMCTGGGILVFLLISMMQMLSF